MNDFQGVARALVSAVALPMQGGAPSNESGCEVCECVHLEFFLVFSLAGLKVLDAE